MENKSVAEISLKKILERKLSFLLESEIMPFDTSDSRDFGERDALQDMLKDSISMGESDFVEKYMTVVVKTNKRFESKEFSIEDRDDYYEAYNNKVVTVLSLIHPENEFYPDNEDKYL